MGKACLAELASDEVERLASREHVPADDQYRAIRFRPEAAIWHKESLFELQLFHPGFLYREPIVLHMANDTPESYVQFKQEFFNYDGPAAPLAGVAPDNIGFAGFRIHYPLNSNDYKDEFVVFQGASYFRMVGPGLAYGLSARGLAIDTAEPKGEEFPVFREFWLIKPGPNDTHLVIYALLDSPSITGAYRFEIMPGAPTEMAVEARLALWMGQHEAMLERWRAMLVEIRAASGTDYAMYAVANRELLDLALSGQAVIPASAAAELEPAA